MKTMRFVLLGFLLSFYGCAVSYTVSSGDLLNTLKKVVTKGKLEFRSATLTIVNPCDEAFIVILDGESRVVWSRWMISTCVNVNLLPDGDYKPFAVGIVPMSGNSNSIAQSWTIQPRSSSSVWIIQKSGNYAYLRCSGW